MCSPGPADDRGLVAIEDSVDKSVPRSNCPRNPRAAQRAPRAISARPPPTASTAAGGRGRLERRVEQRRVIGVPAPNDETVGDDPIRRVVRTRAASGPRRQRSTDGMYASSICQYGIRHVVARHAQHRARAGRGSPSRRGSRRARPRTARRGASCTITTRPVFAAEASSASSSSGFSVRMSSTSTRIRPRARRRPARERHHRAVRDQRDVGALARDPCLAERTTCSPSGTSPRIVR